MRLWAIVIIPRKDRVFLLDETIIIRSWGFERFRVKRAPSTRKAPNGYGVAMILQPSPIDEVLGYPTLFIKADELEDLIKAMDRSDDLTHKMIGHGWTRGPRPYLYLYEMM